MQVGGELGAPTHFLQLILGVVPHPPSNSPHHPQPPPPSPTTPTPTQHVHPQLILGVVRFWLNGVAFAFFLGASLLRVLGNGLSALGGLVAFTVVFSGETERLPRWSGHENGFSLGWCLPFATL